MPAPTSLAAIGTRVPGATVAERAAHGATHPRFADVRAYVHGNMPTVAVGQIYEDLDPRSTGRTIRILAIRRDGKVLAKTLTARTCAPRTPAQTSRDTVGATSWISQRRLRPNSRGFRLIEDPAVHPLTCDLVAPKRGRAAAQAAGQSERESQVLTVALPLAKACGAALTECERRVASALIELLGFEQAKEYLGLGYQPTGGAVSDMYADQGAGALLADALLYAQEQEWVDEWAQTVLLSEDTVATIA